MTLANQLTILRMCLVPGLVILLVYGFYGWALGVFLIAGATDALDGLFARIRNERTELGTMLDPLADKLLVTASLIALSLPSETLTVRIPAWITILSISRDVGILLAALVFNLVIARRSFPPSLLGKATTTVHLAMIVWVIGCNYLRHDHPWTNYLLGATVVLVVASALHYLYWMRTILSEQDGT
jgi:cardiolipin synthase